MSDSGGPNKDRKLQNLTNASIPVHPLLTKVVKFLARCAAQKDLEAIYIQNTAATKANEDGANNEQSSHLR